MEFEITTVDLGNNVLGVTVAGEVDLLASPFLRESLTEAVGSGARGVLVNLSDATFIDSTTLGVLMGATRRMRERAGVLVIVCDNSSIRTIFEITRLDRVFDIFAAVSDAIAYLDELEDGSTSGLITSGELP